MISELSDSTTVIFQVVLKRPSGCTARTDRSAASISIFHITIKAIPKLQFLEQLLTPGENCLCNSLCNKELAIFSQEPGSKPTGFWNRLNFIEIFPSTGDSPAHEQGKAGYSHFCLQVDDAKKSLEELRARGAPIDVELKTGISKCVQFWTHDPDGNRFEFMELPPESSQHHANLRLGKE
jgi:hypothetical protein